MKCLQFFELMIHTLDGWTSFKDSQGNKVAFQHPEQAEDAIDEVNEDVILDWMVVMVEIEEIRVDGGRTSVYHKRYHALPGNGGPHNRQEGVQSSMPE